MNNDLKYWLALNKIHGLGPVTIKKLWEHFGNIKAVFEAEENSLCQIEGLNKPAVKALIDNRYKINLNQELEELEKRKISAYALGDPEYPTLLKNIYDPPAVLYVKGESSILGQKALAIVGTRRASRYGLDVARKLAAELAAMGITIISGLAAGIDTAAHQGALSVNGKTAAVFGCGVDVIFPQENRSLAHEIESSGALISEFPLGEPTNKGNFPRRNRIISGLSLGVIVVEGGYESGAMITAKQALEQGREVFAVPGQAGQEQSKGPHWLIKQGAKLVEGIEDVLEELKMAMPVKMPNAEFRMPNECIKNYPELNEEEKKVVAVLTNEPKYIDTIADEAKLPVYQVSSLLMMLEMKQTVKQLPGKYFVLG
jgi:DNA processing protein